MLLSAIFAIILLYLYESITLMHSSSASPAASPAAQPTIEHLTNLTNTPKNILPSCSQYPLIQPLRGQHTHLIAAPFMPELYDPHRKHYYSRRFLNKEAQRIAAIELNIIKTLPVDSPAYKTHQWRLTPLHSPHDINGHSRPIHSILTDYNPLIFGQQRPWIDT
jgi:hypothetical protein